MSLVKTLAKVAIGVAVAKGISNVVKGGQTPGGRTADGGLFGGTHSPSRSGQGTGLEDLMGSVLGGRSGAGTGGGLGGLLEQMTGGAAKGGAAGGGLGGLIEGLSGKLGTPSRQSTGSGGSFGDVLNSSFDQFGETAAPEPSPDQEALAGLLLTAMIQAAKSDGKIDAAEKSKLLDKLGDVSQEEMAFVQSELSSPVDIAGLVRKTPKGLEHQVYLMSVMGIDLDSQKEAQYLHELAGALGISKSQVNDVHAQLGVPQLYT